MTKEYTASTDEELIEEIDRLAAEIKTLCAGVDPSDVPQGTHRGDVLAQLQAAMAEARRCVCQDKLAKWEARRNG